MKCMKLNRRHEKLSNKKIELDFFEERTYRWNIKYTLHI